METQIQKLFFELLQVAAGQLDCLSRGPSPEEWHELYRMVQRQQVVALGYQGLQRLFEFGLRAPQDVSIDWMADAETVEEQQSALTAMNPSTIVHPLRHIFYSRWIKSCGGSLYTYIDRKKVPTPSAAVVMLLTQSYELFNNEKLTLAPLLELYQVLKDADGKLPAFRTGATVPQVLHKLGIWQFSCAVMWVLGEVMALKPALMPCTPQPAAGQFVLQQLFTEKRTLADRIRHAVVRFIRF